MPIEMRIFYHVINSVVTGLYYVLQLWFLSDVVEHKRKIGRTLFVYSSVYVLTTILTETAAPVLLKSSLEMLGFIVLYRLLLSEKTALVALYVVYFWFFSIMLQEQLIVFICKMLHTTPWIDIGRGVQLGKARVIFVSVFFAFVLTFVMKRILKSIFGEVSGNNTWFLVLVVYILYCVDEILKLLCFQYVKDTGILLLAMILIVGIAVVGVILNMYFVRALYLEKRQREERFKMEALEKQFTYYQEKQRDEEHVRSVYHDMKNHLLVLEHQMHSPETVEMVERLQREVESYADYVHTGNDFLDVILKDKARLAREKEIDFSVTADLHDTDFIEPLDISTIFGNGLDNAIEASEKLPEGQRVILVKVGRVHDFLSILMENNCIGEDTTRKDRTRRTEKTQNRGSEQRKHTDKKDTLLHGFGISNMKAAADKYGGQLTTMCDSGKFTLKIIVPIP